MGSARWRGARVTGGSAGRLDAYVTKLTSTGVDVWTQHLRRYRRLGNTGVRRRLDVFGLGRRERRRVRRISDLRWAGRDRVTVNRRAG